MRRSGTGTVHRHRNGWRARIIDAKGRKISLGIHPTKELAEAEVEAASAQLAAQEPIRGCVDLLDYGTRFFIKREAHGIRSVKQDRNRWKAHVEKWECAKWPLGAIRPVHVRAWRDLLLRTKLKKAHKHKSAEDKCLSKQTVKNCLNLVRICFEFAIEDGLLSVNPAREVKLPPTVGLRTREAWTYILPPEQVMLLAACPVPERYAVQFAIGSGLRQGEQWNLELTDVHVVSPHPHVVVRFGSKGQPPKNGEMRVVPLGAMALEAMRLQLAWLESRDSKGRLRKNPHGLAFPTMRGHRRQIGPPRHWAEWLAASKIKGVTGTPIRWHDLRHTCASMLVSGYWGRMLTLEETKGVMGHKDLKSTQRYAHLAPSAVFRAMAGTGDWRPTPALECGPLVVSRIA